MTNTTQHPDAWRGEVRSETRGNIEARVDPNCEGRQWFVDVDHRDPHTGVYTLLMAHRPTRDEAIALAGQFIERIKREIGT